MSEKNRKVKGYERKIMVLDDDSDLAILVKQILQKINPKIKPKLIPVGCSCWISRGFKLMSKYLYDLLNLRKVKESSPILYSYVKV